jgi:hypothetical protein
MYLVNSSGPVGDHFGPLHPGAVSAAEEAAVGLHTVAYDLHAAVLAGGSQGVDSTLEAVEGMRVATGRTYLKGLIVLISTDLALSHSHILSGSRQSPFLRWIPWVRLEQTPTKSKGRCRKMGYMPTIRVFQSYEKGGAARAAPLKS